MMKHIVTFLLTVCTWYGLLGQNHPMCYTNPNTPAATTSPYWYTNPQAISFFLGWESNQSSQHMGACGTDNGFLVPPEMGIESGNNPQSVFEYTLPTYVPLSNQQSAWSILERYGDGTYRITSAPATASPTFQAVSHTYPFQLDNANQTGYRAELNIMKNYLPPKPPPMGGTFRIEQQPTFFDLPSLGSSTLDPMLRAQAFVQPGQQIYMEHFLNPVEGSYMVWCINYNASLPSRQEGLVICYDADIFTPKNVKSYFGEKPDWNIVGPLQAGNFPASPLFQNSHVNASSAPTYLTIDLRNVVPMEDVQGNKYNPLVKTIFVEVAVASKLGDINKVGTSTDVWGGMVESFSELDGSLGNSGELEDLMDMQIVAAHDPNSLTLSSPAVVVLTDSGQIMKCQDSLIIPYNSDYSCRPLTYTVRFENDGTAPESTVIVNIPIPATWSKGDLNMLDWSDYLGGSCVMEKKLLKRKGKLFNEYECDTLRFTFTNIDLRGTAENIYPLAACQGWVRFTTLTQLDPSKSPGMPPDPMDTYASIQFMSTNDTIITDLAKMGFCQVGGASPLALSGTLDQSFTNNCVLTPNNCQERRMVWETLLDFVSVNWPFTLLGLGIILGGIIILRRSRRRRNR